MTFLKIPFKFHYYAEECILPLLSQNGHFPPRLQLHWPFNSLLIFKISITECTFITMQEIKTVYWRKLLYTPVGSWRFFTFVYSAEMKYLVLRSRRWLGELNIPLAAEVWCLVKLLFTNLCHQKAQETFLICYYRKMVLACFPTMQELRQFNTSSRSVQRQNCYSTIKEVQQA